MGVALAGIVGYSTSKYNFQKPKTRSILEEQYLKVFTPIHSLIFYSDLDEEDLKQGIDGIIAQNYELVPQPIILVYKKYGLDNETEGLSFQQYIDKAYSIAASKLGYTQIKLKHSKRFNAKMNRDIENMLATSKMSKELKYEIISAVFCILAGALIAAGVLAGLIVEFTN